MLTRPLLVGRGAWAQKIYAALPPGVQATISGSITARECLEYAKERGNDSVIIASRTDSHAELLKLAFTAKLPVFCEKPLCMSTHEAEACAAAWRAAGEPPFLCDFVHLWSLGFDYAWPRFKVNMVSSAAPPPRLTCVFGGNVQRKDIHPVWDYGCHGVAMALMLGYDLRGMTLERCGDCSNEWTLHNEHVSIHVHATPTDAPLPGKMARVFMHGVFEYGETVDGASAGWHFKDGERTYKNSDSPPLQRALKWFCNTNKDAWRSSSPGRDGMWLPLQVTRVLESVCSSKSPFA